jgi:hypothetical protein
LRFQEICVAVSAYSIGIKYAKSLAKRGKVDRDSSWGFTAEDGDKLLGADGDDWGLYGKFHLGTHPGTDEDTKAHWAYPFGKNGKVYRHGIIAAKSRAAAEGHTAIETAANEILEIIDANKDSVTTAERASRTDFFDFRDWQTQKLEKTSEGFLKGRTAISNIGVFGYRNEDGSMRYELRHPDDVFDPESLATLDGKPLTNDHPAEGVDPNNVQGLAVGTVHSPTHDAYHVMTGIVIHRADALADVGRGKVALSAGYHTDLKPERGVYLGVPYTHRQTNIHYNHVAIVDEGRAGDAARLRMDGIKIDHNEVPTKGEKMAKIRLDSGAEFEVPEAIGSAYEALHAEKKVLDAKVQEATAALEAANKAVDKAAGELDAAKAEVVRLEKEKAEGKESGEDSIQRRVALLTSAQALGAKVDAKMTERAVRTAVIALDTTDSMEGKSDEYVLARFDGAVTTLSKRKPATEAGGSTHSDGALGSSAANEVAAAKQKRADDLKNAYKREKETT